MGRVLVGTFVCFVQAGRQLRDVASYVKPHAPRVVSQFVAVEATFSNLLLINFE